MSQIRNVYNSSCVVLIHPNASWTFVLPSDRHKSISKIWPTHNLTKFGWNYWTVDGQGYSDLLKILTNFGRSTDLTPRIIVYGLLQNGFNFCRCLQQFAGFTQVNEISALQKKQFFFIASDKGMMHVSTADFILDDYQILINMDIDALKERNNLGKVDISDDLAAVLMLRELVGYRKRTREYGGYQRMTNNATSRSILEKDIFDSFKEKMGVETPAWRISEMFNSLFYRDSQNASTHEFDRQLREFLGINLILVNPVWKDYRIHLKDGYHDDGISLFPSIMCGQMQFKQKNWFTEAIKYCGVGDELTETQVKQLDHEPYKYIKFTLKKDAVLRKNFVPFETAVDINQPYTKNKQYPTRITADMWGTRIKNEVEFRYFKLVYQLNDEDINIVHVYNFRRFPLAFFYAKTIHRMFKDKLKAIENNDLWLKKEIKQRMNTFYGMACQNDEKPALNLDKQVEINPNQIKTMSTTIGEAISTYGRLIMSYLIGDKWNHVFAVNTDSAIGDTVMHNQIMSKIRFDSTDLGCFKTQPDSHFTIGIFHAGGVYIEQNATGITVKHNGVKDIRKMTWSCLGEVEQYFGWDNFKDMPNSYIEGTQPHKYELVKWIGRLPAPKSINPSELFPKGYDHQSGAVHVVSYANQMVKFFANLNDWHNPLKNSFLFGYGAASQELKELNVQKPTVNVQKPTVNVQKPTMKCKNYASTYICDEKWYSIERNQKKYWTITDLSDSYLAPLKPEDEGKDFYHCYINYFHECFSENFWDFKLDVSINFNNYHKLMLVNLPTIDGWFYPLALTELRAGVGQLHTPQQLDEAKQLDQYFMEHHTVDGFVYNKK